MKDFIKDFITDFIKDSMKNFFSGKSFQKFETLETFQI